MINEGYLYLFLNFFTEVLGLKNFFLFIHCRIVYFQFFTIFFGMNFYEHNMKFVLAGDSSIHS